MEEWGMYRLHATCGNQILLSGECHSTKELSCTIYYTDYATNVGTFWVYDYAEAVCTAHMFLLAVFVYLLILSLGIVRLSFLVDVTLPKASAKFSMLLSKSLPSDGNVCNNSIIKPL